MHYQKSFKSLQASGTVLRGFVLDIKTGLFTETEL